MITNQQYMATLKPEDCYFVMEWLIGEYGRQDVIAWLGAECVVGDWRQIEGYATLLGDHVYRCSRCGGDMHVGERHVICERCGSFNVYP